MKTSMCRHCKRPIAFSIVVKDEWSHEAGNSYCQDTRGFTATPIRKAEPVLETEIL